MKKPEDAGPGDPWLCMICMYEYHPDKGDPAHLVKPGTSFADVPDQWRCPTCGARKEAFLPL